MTVSSTSDPDYGHIVCKMSCPALEWQSTQDCIPESKCINQVPCLKEFGMIVHPVFQPRSKYAGTQP